MLRHGASQSVVSSQCCAMVPRSVSFQCCTIVPVEVLFHFNAVPWCQSKCCLIFRTLPEYHLSETVDKQLYYTRISEWNNIRIGYDTLSSLAIMG